MFIYSVLHIHVWIHVPEETKVKVVMLAPFFFYFYDKILDKVYRLILAFSLRLQSIMRIQGRYIRSVGN